MRGCLVRTLRLAPSGCAATTFGTTAFGTAAFGATAFVLALFAADPARAAGQAPPPQGAAAGGASAEERAAPVLKMPGSPGSIALLAEHASLPAAQDRLKAAIADARPEVRAVAARVAFVTMSRGRLADLRAALAAESDPVAGAEIARALMTIGREPTFADAVAAATRLRGLTAVTVVATFGRLGTSEIVTHLSALLATGVPRATIASALLATTRADPAARTAVLRHPALENPALRRAYLTALRTAIDGPFPADPLVTWLQADGPARTELIWSLVQAVHARGPSILAPEVSAALAPLIQASAQEITWEALGLAILARQTGLPSPARRWTTLSKDDAPLPLQLDGKRFSAGKTLSEQENGDLAEVLLGDRDAFEKASGPTGPPGPPDATDLTLDQIMRRRVAEPMSDSMRTVPPFVGSLWTDLLRITGCRPSPTAVGAARATYHPEGRVRGITLQVEELTPGCKAAARTLFTLMVAMRMEPVPAAFSEIVVVPFSETAVACASTPPAADVSTSTPDDRPTSGRTLQQPKKTRNVPARYPKSAMDARKQGIVIVEAPVTATGCVSSARVLKGVSVALDASALFAVMAWQYEPARLNGAPVSFLMTVTVNYTIRD